MGHCVIVLGKPRQDFPQEICGNIDIFILIIK
jgi:hypothetical protein